MCSSPCVHVPKWLSIILMGWVKRRLRSPRHGSCVPWPLRGFSSCLRTLGVGGFAGELDSIHPAGDRFFARRFSIGNHWTNTDDRWLMMDDRWSMIDEWWLVNDDEWWMIMIRRGCVIKAELMSIGNKKQTTLIDLRDGFGDSTCISTFPGPHFVYSHSTGGMVAFLSLNRALLTKWDKLVGVIYSAPLIRQVELSGETCIAASLAECCIYKKKTCLDTLDTCTDLEPKTHTQQVPRGWIWIFPSGGLQDILDFSALKFRSAEFISALKFRSAEFILL